MKCKNKSLIAALYQMRKAQNHEENKNNFDQKIWIEASTLAVLIQNIIKPAGLEQNRINFRYYNTPAAFGDNKSCHKVDNWVHSPQKP